MKNIFQIIGNFIVGYILIIFGVAPSFATSEILIFDNDHQNRIIIQNNIGPVGDSYLFFGSSLSHSLQWENSSSSFLFSDDVHFSGNEIKNVKLENRTSAPACNSSVSGKIYTNITTNFSYICNGNIWNKIDDNNFSSGGLKAYLENLDAANISHNQTKDILVTGGNFTPLTEFLISAGATLNYSVINSDTSATINVTGGNSNATIAVTTLNFFGNTLNFLVQ